jgi:hypothetical protein
MSEPHAIREPGTIDLTDLNQLEALIWEPDFVTYLLLLDEGQPFNQLYAETVLGAWARIFWQLYNHVGGTHHCNPERLLCERLKVFVDRLSDLDYSGLDPTVRALAPRLQDQDRQDNPDLYWQKCIHQPKRTGEYILLLPCGEQTVRSYVAIKPPELGRWMGVDGLDPTHWRNIYKPSST